MDRELPPGDLTAVDVVDLAGLPALAVPVRPGAHLPTRPGERAFAGQATVVPEEAPESLRVTVAEEGDRGEFRAVESLPEDRRTLPDAVGTCATPLTLVGQRRPPRMEVVEPPRRFGSRRQGGGTVEAAGYGRDEAPALVPGSPRAVGPAVPVFPLVPLLPVRVPPRPQPLPPRTAPGASLERVSLVVPALPHTGRLVVLETPDDANAAFRADHCERALANACWGVAADRPASAMPSAASFGARRARHVVRQRGA